MEVLILVVHVIAALGIIGLVLLQHGKGADMGAAFGSGASGSLFGATGSANFLSRSTAACAPVFFVTTLVLALLSNFGMNRGSPASGGGVLDRPAMGASAAVPGAEGMMSAAAAESGDTSWSCHVDEMLARVKAATKRRLPR